MVFTQRVRSIFRAPPSFLRLQWFGFLWVALPALVLLLWTLVSLEQLASESRVKIRTAARISSLSHSLEELNLSLERSARQYLVLKDKNSFERYQRARFRVNSVIDALQKEAVPALRFRLEAWKELDEQLFLALKTPARRQNLTLLFQSLSEVSAQIVSEGIGQIDAQANQLLRDIEREQRHLSWFLLGVVCAAFLFALIFSGLSARLIEQLSRAIRSLGSGQLREPIYISGAADVAVLGERLEWLRGQLAELDAEKVHFLRQMLHEFQTPLTAISEGLHLLGDESAGSLTRTQREMLRLLQKNSQSLQQLTETLLAYQLAYRDSHALILESCALQDEFQRLHSQALAHCFSRKITNMSFDFVKTDVSLPADREKLRVMLWHLLLHLLESLPSGGQISFSVTQYPFWVTIEGEAVSSEKLAMLSPSFDVQRLGLAVVRAYAEQHGGDMTRLASARGVLLRLSLPIEQKE